MGITDEFLDTDETIGIGPILYKPKEKANANAKIIKKTVEEG